MNPGGVSIRPIMADTGKAESTVRNAVHALIDFGLAQTVRMPTDQWGCWQTYCLTHRGRAMQEEYWGDDQELPEIVKEKP
jgi:hypothetical protein